MKKFIIFLLTVVGIAVVILLIAFEGRRISYSECDTEPIGI
jgi:hypothetical protein